MKKFKRFLLSVLAVFMVSIPASALNEHILVGYWHNFNNGAANGLKLSQVPTYWDVINLSFGVPSTKGGADIEYDPLADGIYTSEQDFIKDVKLVQARGQKVVLSIGGEKGQVRLETESDRDVFIANIEAICNKYGLDGLDIDFEGQSISFDAGDFDLANPTTPVIKKPNLI